MGTIGSGHYRQVYAERTAKRRNTRFVLKSIESRRMAFEKCTRRFMDEDDKNTQMVSQTTPQIFLLPFPRVLFGFFGMFGHQACVLIGNKMRCSKRKLLAIRDARKYSRLIRSVRLMCMEKVTKTD